MSEPKQPAFVLVRNPTVQWPVTVNVPTDGGTFAPHCFTATFRVLTEEGYLEIFPHRSDEDAKKMLWKDVLDAHAASLPKVVVGWDVKDTDGAPVSIEHLPAALRGEHGKFLAAGLVQAATEIRIGMPARAPAVLGNSPTAPGTGPDAPPADLAPTSSPTI